MITQEQIQEAIDLYPLSEFVEWYQNKFPTKVYVCIGCLFVAMGMVLTANHRNA